LYYGGLPYAALPTLPPAARYTIPPSIRGGVAHIPNLNVAQIGSAGVPLGIPGATTGVAGAQARGAALRGRNRVPGARGVAGRNLLNIGRGYATASPEISLVGGDLQVCNGQSVNYE